MAEKKSSLLAVLEVLKEQSDEDHVLTRAEIIEKVENRRGLTMDRRTLYSCIDMLEEYGYSISDFEQNGRGYSLIHREFSEAEILWLCNAVHASNFIPGKASNELIRKLLNTQSEYVRKEYNNTVYLPNRRKTENTELFSSIDRISKAISMRCEISFTYLTYNLNRKLVEKRKKPYIREPRYIVYSEGRGYLIVTDKNRTGFSHYRLDRMKNVRILNDTKVDKLAKELDPYEYAKNKIFMFAGENVYVTLKCQMSILNQMVDLFGHDGKITPIDENTFALKVKGPEKGIIWLAQQYMDSVEVIEPASIREAVRESLMSALDRYQ